MTRGEVARRTHIGSETVRYYEQRGLLPKPPRSAGGFRRYDEAYVRRIRFIKQAKELGFTLMEIKELLTLRLDPETDCGDVKHHAEMKLADVTKKIEGLKQIRAALMELTLNCEGRGPVSDCPILDALDV